MNASPQQKPTTHSLREYIAFLREHRYMEDADFYENDVVAVLKQAGIPDPINLTTREVVATLYGIIDAAELVQVQSQRNNAWDMELVQ